MLFHVSEDPTIRSFAPRASPPLAHPVVWAIDAAHLRNYLLPRDCPRVTFGPGAGTSDDDALRFMADGRPVVAIEAAWATRAEDAPLYCYTLPRETFELHDAPAGYFVSREAVRPERMEYIQRPLDRLRALGVEVRVLPSLWPLHDAVAASTLEFSMIRMRHAQPRP